MANVTNAQLWDALRAQNPSFKSHTAKATAELFTERGFSQLTATDPTALSDFFGLSIRAALQLVNISHARDPLANAGIGEVFDMPNGGIIQRMATQSVKPTSPRFKDLQNGDSVDRWTVRKPETMERFWKQNFDYQSFITLQEYDIKQIFISEYGMSEYLAGIMAGLENGYTIQRYENKLQALHKGINDTELKDTQFIKIETPTTEDAMKAFLYSVRNVIGSMQTASQTSAYNAMGFKDTQDISRLKLLVRSGFKAQLDIYTLAGTFNPDKLNLGVDIVEVENFGGINYVDKANATLYEVYDKNGEMIGYNTTENSNTVKYKEGDSNIKAIDPNSNIYAVLLDKGWLFETIQNGYRVMPTGVNEAGLYQNFWASAPNNSINYDRLYTFIKFGTGA